MSLPADTRPMLLVIVDAEEEFDWSRPFSRDERAVRSMAAQHVMHRVFERYGIKPCYVVDYAVASQPDGYLPLLDLLRDGACTVGTQLHPWVTPPFEEELNERNSYPGNLRMDLERRKLAATTEAVAANLGVAPRVFKAGRYGIGPNTFRILAEAGYTTDVSVIPGMDLRRWHGPDLRRFAPCPYWIDRPGHILEIPLSRGYIGALARLGSDLEGMLESPFSRRLRLPAVLSRTGLFDRITLTPEGVPAHRHPALLRTLLKGGHRVFTLSYHSPSLVSGNTPYVRSTAALRRFIDSVERFCDDFLGRVGGVAVEPLALRALIASQAGAVPARAAE